MKKEDAIVQVKMCIRILEEMAADMETHETPTCFDHDYNVAKIRRSRLVISDFLKKLER